VLVGHSAGGHLSLLAAKRTGVPVVALAAVCDPPTWENDAVAAFFARKEPTPEASPLAQAPLGVRSIVIHGTADDVVPFEQSERYAEAAGDEATLRSLDGAGHFEPIDPQSPEVRVTVDAVAELL
jgi:pimeloyl-ACP methyl ester carboxylesterase